MSPAFSHIIGRPPRLVHSSTFSLARFLQFDPSTTDLTTYLVSHATSHLGFSNSTCRMPCQHRIALDVPRPWHCLVNCYCDYRPLRSLFPLLFLPDVLPGFESQPVSTLDLVAIFPCQGGQPSKTVPEHPSPVIIRPLYRLGSVDFMLSRVPIVQQRPLERICPCFFSNHLGRPPSPIICHLFDKNCCARDAVGQHYHTVSFTKPISCIFLDTAFRLFPPMCLSRRTEN